MNPYNCYIVLFAFPNTCICTDESLRQPTAELQWLEHFYCEFMFETGAVRANEC